MVATRRRSDSATLDSPQSDHTLRRKNPLAAVSGEKWAESETPKTPTPTLPGVAVDRRAESIHSAPTHHRKSSPFTISSASFSFLIPKSVMLHDWWLIKAEGKKFGVGGFASRESRKVLSKDLYCGGPICRLKKKRRKTETRGESVLLCCNSEKTRYHNSGNNRRHNSHYQRFHKQVSHASKWLPTRGLRPFFARVSLLLGGLCCQML